MPSLSAQDEQTTHSRSPNQSSGWDFKAAGPSESPGVEDGGPPRALEFCCIVMAPVKYGEGLGSPTKQTGSSGFPSVTRLPACPSSLFPPVCRWQYGGRNGRLLPPKTQVAGPAGRHSRPGTGRPLGRTQTAHLPSLSPPRGATAAPGHWLAEPSASAGELGRRRRALAGLLTSIAWDTIV